MCSIHVAYEGWHRSNITSPRDVVWFPNHLNSGNGFESPYSYIQCPCRPVRYWHLRHIHVCLCIVDFGQNVTWLDHNKTVTDVWAFISLSVVKCKGNTGKHFTLLGYKNTRLIVQTRTKNLQNKYNSNIKNFK